MKTGRTVALSSNRNRPNLIYYARRLFEVLMDVAVHIRPFEVTDREYDAVAHIAAHFPADQLGDFEHQRGAELRAFDESFEGSGHALKRYVAETDGAIVGYAQLFHIP